MTDISSEDPGVQPPPGEVDIGQIGQAAFGEAHANGLEPQEAFDAAAGAIREAGAEAGVPPEVVEAGISAAHEAFLQNMSEGGDPVEAFEAARQAGDEAADDGFEEMAEGPPPPGGEMAEGAAPVDGEGDWATPEGDMPPPEGEMAEGAAPVDGEGDMLDAAMSSEGSEPPTGESSDPNSADLALEQAVSESEADQAQQQPADGFADHSHDDLAEGDVQPDEAVDESIESAEIMNSA